MRHAADSRGRAPPFATNVIHFLPARMAACKMARTGLVGTMQRHFLFAALLSASLAGCGRKDSSEAPALTPLPSDLPGVYVSSFACSNCKVIAATLWLRGDSRFFLRQRYFGGEGASEDASYAFGLWTWDETTAELVLRTGGPERHLKRLDGERLELVTNAGKDLFTRDQQSPAFTDRVRLDGESTMTDHGATFTQCVTGLEMPIASNDALKELRRLHRSLNPTHKVALTAVDAHIVRATTANEQLVIDKVIAIKPGSGC